MSDLPIPRVEIYQYAERAWRFRLVTADGVQDDWTLPGLFATPDALLRKAYQAYPDVPIVVVRES